MPSSRSVDSPSELLTPADSGLRLGAFMLDMLLTVITVEVIIYFLTSFGGQRSLNWSFAAVILILLFFMAVNLLLLPGISGQTIGKKLLGIRIAYDDGSPLTFSGAIKRHLIGYPLSALPLMFGFLRILWDSNYQGWHDKLAKTVVVKVI
jgi:uncharacterized RDD family membrane protein YckC